MTLFGALFALVLAIFGLLMLALVVGVLANIYYALRYPHLEEDILDAMSDGKWLTALEIVDRDPERIPRSIIYVALTRLHARGRTERRELEPGHPENPYRSGLKCIQHRTKVGGHRVRRRDTTPVVEQPRFA